MNHRLRYTAEKIRKRLMLVRNHRFRTKIMLPPLRLRQLADATVPPPLTESTADWPELPWNSYWGGPDYNFILRGEVSVPAAWQGPAALWFPIGSAGDIFNHPEGLLYLNRTPIGSVDRNHHTIQLPSDLTRDVQHDIALHGWTGLFGWPPDPDSHEQHFLPPCWLVERVPALDELLSLAEAALESAEHLDETRPEHAHILNALDSAFLALDTRDPIGDAMFDSASDAVEALRQRLAESAPLPGVTLHGIGHAHMDIAYLWPISQIRQKNARTYSNVLRLMGRFPAYRFSHSQPALYEMTRQDFPEIFAQIRERIAEGRWEVMGGMWVEPDANMPGAEALVRQILLGRSYFREQFGDVETPVLWLPDTFGFPWCLPQLMNQAGLSTLVTNKLNWNQYNRMPSSTTWWQGLDGTKVLAHFLTTPRDVQHLPFPTNYKSDLSAYEVAGTWEKSTARDTVRDIPICYGYGDGGGGPTEDLIRRAEIFGQMPGMPKMEFSTVRESVAAMTANAAKLPVWNDELYLEGHRGVLTSQGWIKRANRQAEILLHEVEALVVMAAPDQTDPQTRDTLREAWRLLCLNQFHDILTGSAVAAVFEDARADFATIHRLAGGVRAAAMARLGHEPNGQYWQVVNTSPAAMSGPVLLAGSGEALTKADLPAGLDAQDTAEGWLVDLPEIAPYGRLALGGERRGESQASAKPSPPPVQAGRDPALVWLENELVRVEINADGELVRLYDKSCGREVLANGETGNQLWAFEDRPMAWDAWDIDAFVEDRGEKIGGVEAIDIVEEGPLRVSVRLSRRYRSSEIAQYIRLRRGSARLDFDTKVDWHEQHILLKAAFPVSVLSPRATYEIQWGEIDRPTHRNTSWDYAKFEVPAQKWATLNEGGFGVALLNDCKHGYDIRDNIMRLSLIKSSTMPDPQADQGRHEFTYALLPHAHDMQQVRQEARALNHPPCVLRYAATPPAGSALVTCDAAHVVIETLKPAEHGEGFVLRLYESERRRGPVRLTFAIPMARVTRVDLLEAPMAELAAEDHGVTLDLSPFEIVSLHCLPARDGMEA